MSIPFRLQVPRPLYEAMLAQAVAELPNECCGLLAGRIQAGTVALGQVVERYPLVNAVASPREFLSDDRSMFAAVRAMRQREIDILAVYHSHPTSEPVPSRTDLERNYSSQVVNLIISLEHAEPCVRGWWLSETGSRAAEWEVI